LLLLSPLALRGVKLRNRVGLAPMCLYSAVDYLPTPWHLAHYLTRSQLTGLTIVEATAVSHQGLVTPQDLGIWEDSAVPPLAELARAITEVGGVAGIQLSHAGRKACRTPPWDGDVRITPDQGGWPIVGPSAIPFADGYATPAELAVEEIRAVVGSYADAARRARQAGYQLLELHAGHGRLLHSFYSPVANRRTDDYGGSWENRVRLLVEVVDAVRGQWPEHLPLAVRLSCVDWLPDGWQLDDSVALAVELRYHGVDLIDCTSGGITRPIRVPTGPGYQVPFAREIRRRAGIATAAVGLIDSPSAAAKVIETDGADVVLLGRRMLLDPYLLYTAGNAERPSIPVQYQRGVRSLARASGSHHIPEL
jgi:2,4-dienoyl-CoA reductase-like NADH-dependent reductase (Old Yellow Enzyme family)